MENIKSDRENKTENFLKQICSQEEWEIKENEKINNFYKNFSNELEDYIYIKDKKMYKKIKTGGYIRYFNLNDELKWGGILLSKYKNNDINLMVLGNSNFNRLTVSFNKNYVFYKKHTTQADKTKKIFLSYLDKYE